MLTSLRATAQGWLGRLIMAVVMGFIILSFAIWGIGDIFRNFRSGTLAWVGNTEISTETYRNAYQTSLQREQRLAHRNITNEEAHQGGLDQQVLYRLVGEAALDDEARRLALMISDEDVKKAILSDENFKGMNGQFDRFNFQAYLRSEGLNEKVYMYQQRGVLLRRELIDTLTAGLQPPKTLLEAIQRYQSETRTVDYIKLPAPAASSLPAASEEELKKYFEQKQVLYRIPEFRALNILTLTPASLAKPDQVADIDARKRYDEVKNERFGQPEKRAVEQILFANEPEAEAARAKLNAGKTFEDLLGEKNLSLKDASLGTVTQNALVDKSVGAAAFALKEGEVSQPVKAGFGPVLVRVTKIIASTIKPYEDVAGELKKEIALQRAQSEITRLHDVIEDQRTSGKTLAEAAAAAGLEAREIPAVNTAGDDPQGAIVKDLTDPAPLLHAAFASDVGVDNDVLSVKGGGYQWFEVTKVDKARDKTFEEAKAAVEKAWRDDESKKLLASEAAGLIKKLDGGEGLDAIAKEQGRPEVEHANDVRRSGSVHLPRNAVAQIFNTPVHRAGSVESDDGGRIVFQVADSTVPPFDPNTPELTNIIGDIKAGFSEDIIEQYLARLQSDVGVKVNNKALATATGISPDSN
ncbi:MAG TPA: SurA N-terminal domain-containing protein [Methylocella sp.]|nr:SurA N-terminal domain-containing protein [Methylocella sp.]